MRLLLLVLALIGSAQAQIVYSDPANLVLASYGNSVGYFNVLTGQTATDSSSIAWDVSLAVSNPNYPSISNSFSTSGRTVRMLFNDDSPVALSAGDAVSASSPGYWFRDGWYLNYGGTQSNLRNDGVPVFMGLQILDGANTYYGWLQLDYNRPYSDGSTGILVLYDFAYNSTPGAAIFAGQTPIPEQATGAIWCGLAAFALMIRRRVSAPRN